MIVISNMTENEIKVIKPDGRIYTLSQGSISIPTGEEVKIIINEPTSLKIEEIKDIHSEIRIIGKVNTEWELIDAIQKQE